MEAIHLDCGAGGPQLKRIPLGGGSEGRSMSPRLVAATLFLLGLCLSGQSPQFWPSRADTILRPNQAPPEHTDRRRETLDSVVHLYRSALSHSRFGFRAVVADSATFSKVWNEVVGDSTKPRPIVDFHKSLVIVAALGEVPSTSYHIRIDGFDTVPGATRVYVHLSSLSSESTCPTEPMFTSPADIALVPRPNGLVIFRESYIPIQCR